MLLRGSVTWCYLESSVPLLRFANRTVLHPLQSSSSTVQSPTLLCLLVFPQTPNEILDRE